MGHATQPLVYAVDTGLYEQRPGRALYREGTLLPRRAIDDATASASRGSHASPTVERLLPRPLQFAEALPIVDDEPSRAGR